MTNDHLNGSVEGSEALRASEVSYRRLFEAAQDGILILDVDTGRITDANPFFGKLLGFSHREMVGQTVGELSPFKDIESNQVMLEQLQEHGYVRYEDLPLETKDGRKIAVEFVCNLYQAGDKKVIQCNVRDITGRKRSEAVAIRLASIVESSDDAIIGKDLNSMITNWNKGATRIFGYTADEMIGTSIMRLIPADRQDEENQILSKIRHGESVEHFETLRQAKDGRLIAVSVTASPINDANGNVVGVSKVARDITERLQAVEALRKSEERFRSYFELGQIGMAITSSTKGCLEVNDKMCQILGYERSELLHMTWAEMTHPDDLAADVNSFNRVLAGEFDGYSTNKRFLRKDGRVVDSTITVKCLRREDGSIDYFVAMLQDITEQHRMEDALRESEVKFRTLFDVANDAIFILHNGSFTDCNAKGLEYFRVKREEIIGRSPADFSPSNQADGRDSAEKATEFNQAALAGKPQFFEWMNQRPDGTSVCSDVSLSRFEVCNQAYLQAIARDITERKRAEEQIAEQAALLDNARDSILVCDLDGKILFWNKGSERMYGWTRREVLDRNIACLLYPNPKKFEEIRGLTNSLGEWHGELQKLAKDRHEMTVEARWTLIRDKKGDPKSMLSINTDITERKKIEAQFMRAQRMESIGTLAGGIAHDLNNILAPIMMSIDILKLTAQDPQAKTILKTIEVSAKRGADIVRQVLSFARGLEGARTEIQPKHLLKDLETITKDTFPKNIRLQFSVPNDIWTILGDPTQVHQILLNLCVNARDAMPNGGNLTISVENCTLDDAYVAMNIQAKPGRYINIAVTDSGTGMPPAVVDKIFEPFFTTKELNKGTGLGLSTVMAIVKSHDGVINVYSEPGQGTTFNVYLPAMEISSEARKEQTEKASLPRGNGETILLVDDEASILVITSQTLQAFGYRVLTATDGAEAVAIYAQHRHEIAVVLTDMMMPIMDGPATIRALTKIDPEVKIIAASGLNANAEVAKVSGMGLKHFLTKPYTAGTLLKTLRIILDEA
jgi:PAS domain S-box-containing protein